ncbi:type VI secretion system baseplate subunit TssF [Photobacterium rosenbergii]|uniref:Type VI secretion system baseplate subunit TssF n=1 Tax=Photobacterium rosenbergii TaxID=294936 RepID=A0A2T3NKV0_9GAMM|nr:type VI secretion system baseplate subunit TssF [Photobacterium rosenbergii]PSW16137.1 type VI secretion system baseplate subunit TssF [Photobacterium rosenbergii]
MSDQLLSYYERELAYIRQSLEGFGQQFPEHASSMRLNQSGQEDPNISRLIDAVALLTAKTEKRIDEQFPEVLQDLFNVLYPGYLQTVPSYAPFKLELSGEAGAEPLSLAKGSELSVQINQSECLFTLVDELVVAPYDIAQIEASSAPFNFPTPKAIRRADAVIQLTLKSDDPSILFSQMALGHFDFYVRGFENSSRGLIDLLLLNTEAVSLLDETGCQLEIDVGRLRSRVADPDFNWLPQYGNHLAGFDQLRDYFAFPDKAAYLRIDDLGKELMQFSTNTLTLNFFVQQLPTEFLRLFTSQVFALNTVPAINLYQQHGEPIRYDFTKLAMPVVADVDNDSDLTVVSIDTVNEVLPTGDAPLMPVYDGGYWLAQQRPKWQARQKWDEKGRRQTEISISDADMRDGKEDVVLSLLLNVCNGRLPCLIPSHTEADSLAAVDLPGLIRVVKTPTAPQYPSLDNHLSWRFIALLNANFSSLVQVDDPTRVLQDVVRLCCNSIHCSVADAIKKVTYRHMVAPVTIGRQSIFSSGTEVILLLDNELLDSEFAVVGEVLNAFFKQFCSFDRFIQLSIERFGTDEPGLDFEKCHGSQLCL